MLQCETEDTEKCGLFFFCLHPKDKLNCYCFNQNFWPSLSLLGPPDDVFSRLAAGGQKPVDRVYGSVLQPAVNLKASVLNVWEVQRKQPSFRLSSGVLVISCLFSKGIRRWPVSWQLYKCDITSWGIPQGSSYCVTVGREVGLIHAQSKQNKSATKRLLLSQDEAEKTERKAAFLSLWRQTKQPLHTWVCLLFSSFHALSSCVIETIESTWKDHFMFGCRLRGFGQLGFHLLCLSPVTEPFVIIFFLRLCLVWTHFKDMMCSHEAVLRSMCFAGSEESKPVHGVLIRSCLS